ncbi:PilC/PilY family type IV pilus protein [Desulfonema ishimotonii]|uniref:PilC/PilY family type IV pilus protein n=1 Tax=Desulfonema ishimotonii TaxID=45657 RepID=UPI001407AFBD|nr:PilC/PilY family type IV pilus protein [Desulfonema ishimotonii]
MKIQKNVTGEFPHVIMVSSDRNQGQWLMGWEDLSGGGDADYNDLLFLITMKMSGEVSLKTKHAISPYNPDLFYKSATIEVFDNIPGSESGCGSSGEITYFISPDGGNKWIEITEWDVVMRSDENGNTYETVADWTPGTPEYTYRSASVDFQALGISGDKLIWKAEMKSEGGCAPGIINVKLNSSFFQSAILSHTSAAVQANVVYTGKYATPGGDWPADEQWLRGHLTATRIYDPAIPVNGDDTATSTHSLWDAGQRLASVNPSARKIYSPEIGGAGIVDADDPEIIAGLVGNGVQDEFTGKLNLPEGATLWPGSLFIADEEGREVFNDVHVKEMMAQSGRSETGGRINRSTGEFSITYSPSRVPRPGKRILAWYRYYNAFGDLREVSSRTITYEDLCLTGDDSCDFDEDGAVDENDADWLTNWVRGYKDGKHTAKTWLLGAIDHSTPAFCAPPGLPEWYDTLACEEKESYLRFREEQKERRSVLYAGAKDGMLHAFDAGAFRWGDNPKTPTVTERHGYFKWKGSTSGTADYGDGDELWAFIPADLLSRLKHNVAADDASVGVDGSPVIADVFVNDAWRTVLICGEGTGGESVFCLDVTEPETPRFMWEFIDADMFGTRSAPVIARVLTDNGSKWAAFFVSDTVATDCDSDEESDYCYPSVFVVDVADGSLIQRIFLDSEADGKNGIPAGPPAVLDMDGNGFADRFYLGTDKGFMYKVNMPDDGASFNEADDCIIAASNGNTVTTPNQPIYAAPAVVKKDGQATLFFGTGDSPFKSDSVSGAQYHFFAYTDQSDKMACGTVDLDWFITLPSGYKVFAPAAADDANVYLTTSTADTESLYDFSGTTYSDRSASSGQKRDTDSMTVSVVTYSVVTYPDSGNNTKIISRYDITLASSPGGIGNLYALSQKNEEYVNGTAVVIGDTVSLPVIADRHVYVNTIFNGLKSFGSGSYNNITGEGTLKNAIRILKMLAGDSSEIVTTDMDMSGDGKVGIEDVVYILRTISETQAPSQSGGAQEGAGANKDYYGDDASGTDLFGETNGF